MHCFPLQQNGEPLCSPCAVSGLYRDHMMSLKQVLRHNYFYLLIRFLKWYQFNGTDIHVFIVMYVKAYFKKLA